MRGFSLLVHMRYGAVTMYRLDLTSSDGSRFEFQPVPAFIKLS